MKTYIVSSELPLPENHVIATVWLESLTGIRFDEISSDCYLKNYDEF